MREYTNKKSKIIQDYKNEKSEIIQDYLNKKSKMIQDYQNVLINAANCISAAKSKISKFE